MKKSLLILLSLALLLSLASCQGKNYTDDVAVLPLVENAISALGDDLDFSTAQSGYLDDYFTTPSYVTDSVIQFATSGNNLDEVGIFHVTAGNAKEMASLLEDYLSRSYEANQAWYDSYIPQETPKLRDAEVKAFGNYVVYAILSSSDRTVFFNGIEAELSE